MWEAAQSQTQPRLERTKASQHRHTGPHEEKSNNRT